MFISEGQDVNGRCNTSITNENVQAVEKIVKNRRINLREVTEDITISVGSYKFFGCDREMLNDVKNDSDMLKTSIISDKTGVNGYDETKA